MNRWITTMWLMAAVFCAGLVAGAGVSAEDESEGGTTVTVNRNERNPATIPGPVTIITADEISRMGAKTLVDVLRMQPGINVRDVLGNGRFAAVDIRGGGSGTSYEKAQGVMVMVDGRPVVHPYGYDEDYGASVNWPVIPVQDVERIEIFRGSNSVVWGTNAVMGTINIVTKKAPEDGHRLVLGTRVGSYDAYSQYVGMLGNVGGIAYSANAGYDTSDGYVARNRFRTRYTNLQLSGQPTDWFGWSMAAGTSEDQIDAQAPMFDGADRLGRNDWVRMETQQNYISFTPSFAIGCGQFSVPLHYTEWESHNKTDNQDARFIDYRIMPQYAAEFEMFCLMHNLVFGIDYHVYEMNDDDYNGDEYQRNIGYFVHDTVALMPDELFLDLGYRRTRVNHDSNNGKAEGANHFNSYEAGLTWIYAENSRMFARFARGYVDTALYEWPDEVADQRFREYQVGISHSFCDWLTAGATFFRIEGEDEYYYDYAVADSVRQGIELEMVWQPVEKVRVAANYMYVDARWQDNDVFPDSNTDVHGQPSQSAAVMLTVFPVENLTVDLRAKMVHGNEMFYDSEDDTDEVESWEGDSYMVVDSTMSYDWKWFTFYVGVNNIFDEEYSEVGLYDGKAAFVFPSPERNFYGGVNFVKEF